MLFRIKEPFNSLSHLIGALLSIAGLVILIYQSAINGTVWQIVSFAIYGTSLILLFSASSIYHMLDISEKVDSILRKIDHMMIFILIAGTYTPIALVILRGGWGWTLFGIVWGIAITGIIMKVFWINMPRWLSTSIYVMMGWIAIIAFIPLTESVPKAGFAWLVAGGIIYTIGAVIYGTKWPNITNKYIGFHEIFHLFVLAGSICHFWFMYNYVL